MWWNSLIDRVNGVICSDLKVSITPVDREKYRYRYLVNFIDHKTNHTCILFFAKTKDEAAKKFWILLALLNSASIAESKFYAPIHNADGGDEYTNLDLFCK